MEPAPMATFCDVCKTMFKEIADSSKWTLTGFYEQDNTRSFEKTGGHHMSSSDLFVAAAHGCATCVRLQTKFRDNEDIPYSQPGQSQPWLNYKFTFQIGARNFNIWLHEWSTQNYVTIIICFRVDESLNTGQHHYCHNTKDEAVLQLAHKWLSDCGSQHLSCGDNVNQHYQPPRLLQLDGQSVRLLETNGKEYFGRYATLSYCWGRHPRHITLTANNIFMFRKSCDINRLAKTFRDTIHVAQSLDIHFLWIDALCILQSGEGHREDWQRHLAEMAEIYANCTLNIAVDHGEDADAGCFRRRTSDDVKPCQFDLTQIIGNLMEADPQEDEKDLHGMYALRDGAFESDLFGNCPLRDRAWVCQERILSPRILHFGKKQIIWECSELSACETYPKGLYFLTLESKRTFSLGRVAEGYWPLLVYQYSKSSLTNLEERLPAIAGIAKEVCTRQNTTYAAGLLTCYLPRCLFWRKWNAQFLDSSAIPYRAPSWSWASHEGSTMYGGHTSRTVDQRHLASIDSVDLQYTDKSNPFGSLQGGSMTITAPLFLVAGLTDDPELDAHREFIRQQEFELLSFHTADDLQVPFRGIVEFDESPLVRPLGDTYLLFISYAVSEESAWGTDIYGLLVATVNSKAWIRVGLYSFHPSFCTDDAEREEARQWISDQAAWLREHPKTTIELH